jgi:hypothetical protein
MKVEHWQSQERCPELQLTWTNLLGACLGGEGSPRADHTCDTRKGEQSISLNPMDPAHVSTLRCRSTGQLQSTDRRFQEDVDERLGLNHRILIEERKSALDREVKRLIARYPKGEIPESALRSRIEELETTTDGKLPALCCVLRLWARRRFGARW